MAQAKIAAPIDRPLSRAYLREFKGWSTAYPPGVSDSSSLRRMHNCSIAADGALRIRPGMRRVLSNPAPGEIVGDLEHFYHQGVQSLLYAYRAADNTVQFQVAKYNPVTNLYDPQPNIDVLFPKAGLTTPVFQATCNYVTYVQLDNKILALSDNTEPPILFDSTIPVMKHIKKLTRPSHFAEQVQIIMPTTEWIAGNQTTIPVAATKTTATLISSDPSKNVYNFAYFFTAYNELGETVTSGNMLAATQRPLSGWRSSWIDSSSPDQLVAVLPQGTWNALQEQGAKGWNLYMYTWSNQGVKPAEGLLLESVDIVGKTYEQSCMVKHTPLKQPKVFTHLVPTWEDKDNFSDPPSASTGLVAGDRLVLVNNMDPEKRARIQWSSNLQGSYLDFSPVKGGGYKTLTSGELYRPETAVLWQNPQSADTITVLCSGPNGDGTAYYMNAGSSVTTQSQANVVMGFEETTATPGTVSPYGCEVLNNALYHPLDSNLMKSTAANYNINHTMMADSIQNLWHRVPLADKRRMVSSQMDNKLYFLLQSPVGKLDGEGFVGNQIWICDTAQNGAWSSWDVQGNTLHRLEIAGLLYMGVTSGRGIYVFDPEYDMDDYYSSGWKSRTIPWEAVTNTQGANRAHDAWSMLYQMSVTFGDFVGECFYGIRGFDRHGTQIVARKHFKSPITEHDPIYRHDVEDFLSIRRELKEWEFYWESVPDSTAPSFGSVSYVQYRYAPISVNVGYAYGEVESFEYGDRVQNYPNGTPLPFADTTKP